MKKYAIEIDTRKANLKRKIRKHLRDLGFVKDGDGRLVPPELNKETYRKLHEFQRLEKLQRNEKFLEKRKEKFLQFIASGEEVEVASIKPRVELVKSDSVQADLFRFASLYWRVPVSEGYGRRIRFLVWDDNIGKLMGIFALGDAVFNLKVRDEVIGWNAEQRGRGLVNLMDAYTMGALPPYNQLLCGKLIASLIRTEEVKRIFEEKYKNSKGIISKKKKHPKLLVVTTTSSLGRSSVYNRLKLEGKKYFQSIGFTSGWGHFHIPENIFSELKDYLELHGDKNPKNFKFGNGPNWRMRTIKKGFSLLGLGGDLAQHGLTREVFICPMADNAYHYLRGEDKEPRYSTLLSVDEVAKQAIKRWVIPRAESRPEYKLWKAEMFLNEIGQRPLMKGTQGSKKNALGTK